MASVNSLALAGGLSRLPTGGDFARLVRHLHRGLRTPMTATYLGDDRLQFLGDFRSRVRFFLEFFKGAAGQMFIKSHPAEREVF